MEDTGRGAPGIEGKEAAVRCNMLQPDVDSQTRAEGGSKLGMCAVHRLQS